MPQPWRIVIPSLIFNFIYLIIALVASILVQDGTDTFCQQLDKNSQAKKCEGLAKLVVNNTDFAQQMLTTVEMTSWATTASWLFSFLLPLFRIIFVIDFRMIKVCVYKIDEAVHNKQEEVVQVTNYEEPSKPVDEATEIDEDFKSRPSGTQKKKKYLRIKKEDLSDESPIMGKKAATGEIFYIKADVEHEEEESPFEEKVIEPRIQTQDEVASGSVVKRVNRPKS